MSQVIGGWRLAGIQVYNSSAPLGLTRNNPLQIFNGITRPQVDGYDNWRIPIKGDRFDPAVDNYFKAKAEFGVQPVGFGNATRYNPKVRGFWGKNENVSISKTFVLHESLKLDFRGEAFNIFNRVVFGNPVLNLDAINFGSVTGQANEARTMQLVLKMYW